MNICVSGAGYVGVSTAALLSFENDVILYDIDSEKVRKINEGFCPINDELLKSLISNKQIKLKATSNISEAFSESEIVVVATNTNAKENGELNVESVIECSKYALRFSPNCTVVIRSTVPVGFTDEFQKKLENKRILFSPEFLRENSELFQTVLHNRCTLESLLF